MSGLRSEPHVVCARLYTSDGEAFATYLRPGATNRSIPLTAPEVTTSFARNSLLVARRIFNKGDFLGSIYLEMDLQELDARRNRYFGIACVVMVLSLLIVLLLAARLHRTISQPIFALAEQARSVPHSKDYKALTIAGGYQEIKLLIESFNSMLHDLANRDAELEDHREHLEDEVISRTQELQTVNTQLGRAKERRRSRQPGEKRISGQHEPRNPHSHERHHRNDRLALDTDSTRAA